MLENFLIQRNGNITSEFFLSRSFKINNKQNQRLAAININPGQIVIIDLLTDNKVHKFQTAIHKKSTELKNIKYLIIHTHQDIIDFILTEMVFANWIKQNKIILQFCCPQAKPLQELKKKYNVYSLIGIPYPGYEINFFGEKLKLYKKSLT